MALTVASLVLAIAAVVIVVPDGPIGGLMDNHPSIQAHQILSQAPLAWGGVSCKAAGGECGEMFRCGDGRKLVKNAFDCNKERHFKDCCTN